MLSELLAVNVCMYVDSWSNADKYHALSPASLGDLTSFANAFLRTLKAEVRTF